MVTSSERDFLWETYAADRRARLNLGIRRRLAPLLERDRRRIELMNYLLLSMPGTPVIYYGDEIGMGDNIHLGDRDGVRTPMQWSPDRNGGFSRADPSRLVLPPIMDALYGFEAVNVEAQSNDRHSLLNWMRAHDRDPPPVTRCSAAARFRLLYPNNRKVLAYLREYDGRDDPVRRQPGAHAAGGGARTVGIHRPHADRAGRWFGVSADRPAHLSAHAAAIRILLVPPDRRGGGLAIDTHPRTGAHARISDHRSARPAGRCTAGADAPCWSAISCRPISPSAAGSR